MSNQESDAERIQRQANELSHHEYSQRNQQSSGCFPAGTQVHTPFGTESIENLRDGDSVVAVSLKTNSKRSCKILKVREHSETNIWEMILSGGKVIRTTAIHSFHSDGKWQMAKSLRKGDLILCLSDDDALHEVEVLESRLVPVRLPVFNLVVENEFNFLAEGVLAHSFSRFRVLRGVIATFLVSARSIRARIANSGSKPSSGMVVESP